MRAVIFLALMSTAFAVPRNMQRIVGGENTNIQQYPYMSNLQYFWFGILWSQSCGGSLLTSSTILSAAHCFEGDIPSQWRVILGTTNRSGGGGSQHAVSQLILHEQYNDRTELDNDVAILRLSQPAVFSDSVGVASIAGLNYNLPDGTIVTAIGWGALSSGGSAPEILQHVDIDVINQELCAQRYAYLKTQPGFQGWPDITDTMLCAGILNVGGKDACQGDSGGPLAHNRNVIVGITSWGYGCAHNYYPGVNARVSTLSEWIVRNGST